MANNSNSDESICLSIVHALCALPMFLNLVTWIDCVDLGDYEGQFLTSSLLLLSTMSPLCLLKVPVYLKIFPWTVSICHSCDPTKLSSCSYKQVVCVSSSFHKPAQLKLGISNDSLNQYGENWIKILLRTMRHFTSTVYWLLCVRFL